MAKDKEIEAMEACHASLAGLDPEEQARVLAWLAQKLNIRTAQPAVKSADSTGAGTKQPGFDGTAATPKAFMASKQPTSDVERITCLAYYLTHYKETPHFKTRDLTTLNSEAHQPTLSNATVASTNAAAARYLSSAGGGKRQITTIGETLVEALPDREAVKVALEKQAKPRRKRRKSAQKRTA